VINVENVRINNKRRRKVVTSPAWRIPETIQDQVAVRQARLTAPTESDQAKSLRHREGVLRRRMDRLVAFVQTDKASPHSQAYLRLMPEGVQMYQAKLDLHHQSVRQLIGATFPLLPPPVKRSLVRMITATDPPRSTHSAQSREYNLVLLVGSVPYRGTSLHVT